MDPQIEHLETMTGQQYEALYQISEWLNKNNESKSLMNDALDLVIGQLKAERGLFVRFQDPVQESEIIAARNIDHADIEDLSQFSSGLLEKLHQEKQPYLFHDVGSDPDLSHFESVKIHQIKSVIGVPIKLNREDWGAIIVDSTKDRALFTDQSLRFLSFFANLLSLSLDRIFKIESLSDENQRLLNQIQSTQPLPDIVGKSAAMQKVASMIHRVAQTDATVLLLGESGTGKDLAARAIHQLSKRKNGPFLAQFCGAIPDSLLSSELFGHKRGAFSGAVQDKKGLFEITSGGTFFLDEIGDISVSLQSKLLRVLQNKEIIRLGDTQVRTVDVRMIVATNKDLFAMVKEEQFREDLYYRLNVFPITLPALRERREDIAALTVHFMQKYDRPEVQLMPATLRKLERYEWPGNVRELENILQRALILCDGDQLQPDHIILQQEQNQSNDRTLKEIEQSVLKERLKQFNNNRTATAESLGVSVRWVQMRIKELKPA
ncbi:GAF domain-containing protein [candidate division KSB1 bacterium]|nr:GAF domain-containing protein [candidate division KSB1 bacterium]